MTNTQKNGYFTCHNHEVNVAYMCFSSDESMAYRYLIGKVNGQQYSLVFYLRDNFCRLIKTSEFRKLEQMVKLNYLPDITPSQFTEFVQKLLDLMVFS